MTTSKHWLILILTLVVVSTAAASAKIPLSVVLYGEDKSPRDGIVRVSVDNEQEHRGLALKIPGSMTLEVGENETAYVTVEVPGFWSDTRALTTTMAAGVSIGVWPAGRVAGRLVSAGGAISRLRLEWQPSHDRTRDDPPAGQTDCDVNEQEFRCTLPAGELDFTLRAQGYIPRYWWNEKLQIDLARDLGRVKFMPGASVSGVVELGKDQKSKISAIALTLIPATDSGRLKEDPRRALIRSQAVPNKRGFFQFPGTAPGMYTLSAVAPGYASEELEIEVVAGLEARLRDPIVLLPPRSMTVTVDPPTDPWGRAWRLRLSRYTSGSDTISSTSEVEIASIPESGVWKSEPLASAKYLLTIGRVPQGEWFSTQVALHEDVAIDAKIPLTKIRGSVRLGKNPVQGVIWFGGERGEVSIPVAVREDGTFRTILPRPENDVWREVDVVADKPMIRRALTDVALRVEPGQEAALLDIHLPSRAIFGEIVDESGHGVSGIVLAKYENGSDAVSQIATDDSGTFSWEGLETGTLNIRAETRQGSSEKSTRVVLPEEESDTPVYVRLIVKKNESLAGTVMSDLGPIAGARLAVQQRNAIPNFLRNIETDVTGQFHLRVAPGATRVDAFVSAPGFAARMIALDTDGQETAIRLERIGGTLVLDVPAKDAANNRVHLTRGGLSWAVVHLAFAVGEDVRSIPEDRVQLTIPRIEPGEYSLCLDPPEAECVRGYLLPFGKLGLRTPETTGKEP